MKRVSVRCHRLPGVDGVWMSFTDCGHGYVLIACSQCGEVHAVDVIDMDWAGGDLDVVLRDHAARCGGCNEDLVGSWREYPAWHRQGGAWCTATIPGVYPPDDESELVEFWSVKG